MRKIITENLKKIKRENKIKKQKQDELQRERNEKMANLSKINKKIRIQNLKRFYLNHTKEKEIQNEKTVPWGADQARLKAYKMQKFTQSERNSKENQRTKLGETQRREQLGLGFLNLIKEEEYHNLLQKLKSPKIEKEQTEKKLRIKDEERNTEIKEYIRSKQRLQENERRKYLENKRVEERRKEELLLYNQEVKEMNKNSVLKRAISMHSFENTNAISQSQLQKQEHVRNNEFRKNFSSEKKRSEHKDEEIDQNFESLNEEYRNLIGHMINHNQGFHQKSLSTPLFNKFQGAAQKGELYSTSPPKGAHMEAYQKNEKSNAKTRKRSDTPPKKVKSTKKEYEDERRSHSVGKKSYSDWQKGNQNKQKQLQNSRKAGDSNIDEELDVIEILHAAATLIQKVWRGHKVRRILLEYLYEFAQQYENIEENQEEEDVDNQEEAEEANNSKNNIEGKISFEGDDFKQHKKEIEELFIGKKKTTHSTNSSRVNTELDSVQMKPSESEQKKLNLKFPSKREETQGLKKQEKSQEKDLYKCVNNNDKSHETLQKKDKLTLPGKINTNNDILTLQEINENSKSLITIKDFNSDVGKDDLKPAIPSDSIKRKKKNKTSSDYLRAHLIPDDNIKDSQEINEKFKKKGEAKSENVISIGNQTGNSYSDYQIFKESEILKTTLELSTKYQNDLKKIREEQIQKWNEIVNQIGKFQESCSEKSISETALTFLINLQKQSEINKKLLIDNQKINEIIIKSQQVRPREENDGIAEPEKKETAIEEKILLTKAETKHVVSSSKEDLEKNTSVIKDMSSSQDKNGSTEEKRTHGHSSIKKNLQIDVENLNSRVYNQKGDIIEGLENEVESSSIADKNKTIDSPSSLFREMNIDISQMRIALGSEQTVREQSYKTISHQTSPTNLSNKDHIQKFESDHKNLEHEFKDPEDIFQQESFKEFTSKKFKELMNKNNMEHLIKMREEALEYRHKTQMKIINSMLKNDRVSPRTFKTKKDQLEKWVTKEKEDIKQTRREIEKGWLKTADTIQRTQRDFLFMQKIFEKSGKFDFALRSSCSEDEFYASSSKPLSGRPDVDLSENEQGLSSAKAFKRISIESSLHFLSIKTPDSTKNIKIIDKYTLSQGSLRGTDSPKGSANDNVEFEYSSARSPLNINKSPLNSQSANFIKDSLRNLKDFSLDQLKSETKLSKEEQNSLKKEENIIAYSNIYNKKETLPTRQLFVVQTEIPDVEPSIPEDSSNIYGILEKDVFKKALNSGFALNLGHQSDPIEQGENELINSMNSKEEKSDLITDLIISSLVKEFEIDIEHFLLKSSFKQLLKCSGEKKTNTIDIARPSPVKKNDPKIISPYKTSTTDDMLGSHKTTEPKNGQQDFSELSIKCSIEAVRDYLISFTNFLKSNYKKQILEKINIPLGPEDEEKLKLLQANVLTDMMMSFQTEGTSIIYPKFFRDAILTQEIFQDHEKLLNRTRNVLLSSRKALELQKSHNKAVFDAFNECLDYYRPYSLKGKPPNWKTWNKKFSSHLVKEDQLDKILEAVREKTMARTAVLCGFIHDKDEFILPDGMLLDEDYITQIREDRMARMLSQEVLDAEFEWIDYCDEETEVELEMADSIFERLIADVCSELIDLNKKRSDLQYF